MGLIRYSCGHISASHELIHVKFGVWGFFMFYWNIVMKMLKCKNKNLMTSHFGTLCFWSIFPTYLYETLIVHSNYASGACLTKEYYSSNKFRSIYVLGAYFWHKISEEWVESSAYFIEFCLYGRENLKWSTLVVLVTLLYKD